MPQCFFLNPTNGAAMCLAPIREAAEVGHMSPQELGESLAARSAGGNEDVQYVDVREVSSAVTRRILPVFVICLAAHVRH